LQFAIFDFSIGDRRSAIVNAAMKCPTCKHENLPGEDRCVQCLHSLMQLDIPHPKRDGGDTSLFNRPVSDLLTGKDLLVCRPTDTAQKIIKIFQKENKSCVLVYEKKMVGILSNRDLVLRVAGRHKDLSKLKISEIMTVNPGSVKPDDPIAFAVNKMSMGGYRHVPVIRDDGTPVSILLIKDVLRYISQNRRGLPYEPFPVKS
jgi:CBS domain-containing protein